jgi:MFS family permease
VLNAPAARGALTILFLVDGMVFASWASRLPQVQQAVGAGNGGLGVALIGTAAGAFIAMPLAGWWCRRHPAAPLALLAALLMCFVVPLPALASSPAALIGLLAVFGIGYGAVDVAMNSAAVQVAEHLERPLLPSFHAAFSAGNVVGAAAGAILAAQGVSVLTHLLGVGAAGALLLAANATGLWRTGVASGVGTIVRGRAGLLVVAAAALTCATAFAEGTVANWSGIHLRDAAAASAGTAPLGYAAFAVAQVAGRIAGTPIAERCGPRRTAAVSVLLAVAGLLCALVPQLVPAIGGYFLAGLGLSCLFPLGVARAGELSASTGVAVASTAGYGGFLLGPPAIGLLAEAGSLSTALLVPVLLLVACAVVVRTLPARTSPAVSHA